MLGAAHASGQIPHNGIIQKGEKGAAFQVISPVVTSMSTQISTELPLTDYQGGL